MYYYVSVDFSTLGTVAPKKLWNFIAHEAHAKPKFELRAKKWSTNWEKGSWKTVLLSFASLLHSKYNTEHDYYSAFRDGLKHLGIVSRNCSSTQHFMCLFPCIILKKITVLKTSTNNTYNQKFESSNTRNTGSKLLVKFYVVH